MGAFEDSIPEKIKEVEKQKLHLFSERHLINWGHDCNCEFCDRDGEEPDEDAENKANKIDEELKECNRTINRLKLHAKEHGVEL